MFEIKLNDVYIRPLIIDREKNIDELKEYIKCINEAPEYVNNRLDKESCADLSMFAIVDKKHVLGFISYSKYSNDSACICFFWISPNVRNQGIGSIALKLFTRKIVKIDENIGYIYLFADSTNKKSVNFYKKNCKYWLLEGGKIGLFTNPNVKIRKDDGDKVYEIYTYISPKEIIWLKQNRKLVLS